MILLKSFNQIISILIYFLEREDSQEQYISSKEIIAALPNLSAESIKKSITRLVNAGILTSVSGPKGGFSPKEGIQLENLSLAELFKIAELNNNVMIMRKFENDLFSQNTDSQTVETKMNEILRLASTQFLQTLNEYTLKDIL